MCYIQRIHFIHRNWPQVYGRNEYWRDSGNLEFGNRALTVRLGFLENLHATATGGGRQNNAGRSYRYAVNEVNKSKRSLRLVCAAHAL